MVEIFLNEYRCISNINFNKKKFNNKSNKQLISNYPLYTSNTIYTTEQTASHTKKTQQTPNRPKTVIYFFSPFVFAPYTHIYTLPFFLHTSYGEIDESWRRSGPRGDGALRTSAVCIQLTVAHVRDKSPDFWRPESLGQKGTKARYNCRQLLYISPGCGAVVEGALGIKLFVLRSSGPSTVCVISYRVRCVLKMLSSLMFFSLDIVWISCMVWIWDFFSF